MANINTTVERVYAATAANSDGTKFGFIASSVKAAQNDTITVTNMSELVDANIRIVATGAAEGYTVSGNVITLTSATTGAVRAMILYK